MEQTARSLYWFAAIDPGNPTLINHPIQAKNDAANYTAINGHSAYYYPYFLDVDTDHVSPSIMMCAYALQLYATRGIQEPPAGTAYPLRGIGGVQYKLSDTQKNDLATAKINICIYKNGVGFVIYDTLTRSINPKFKMISARIILNCIEKSVQQTIDISGLLFQSIGSTGVFFVKLRSVIENVVSIFYADGALFGATPEAAFYIQCDATIQKASDLEQGVVNALLYLVPSATARQINTVVYPITIGGIPAATLLG
jgi:hypothetical protein